MSSSACDIAMSISRLISNNYRLRGAASMMQSRIVIGERRKLDVTIACGCEKVDVVMSFERRGWN